MMDEERTPLTNTPSSSSLPRTSKWENFTKDKWKVGFTCTLLILVTALISAVITWQINLVKLADEPPIDRFSSLKGFCSSVAPIGLLEFLEFQNTLSQQLRANGITAYVTEPGANMKYLSGVSWSLSERPFLMILFSNGSLFWVSPAFEVRKATELIPNGQLFFWEENESPYLLVGKILGIVPGGGNVNVTIGVDDEIRYFIVDGLQQQLSGYGLNVVNGKSIIQHQRMRKSTQELKILDCANRATKKSIEMVIPYIKEGMTEDEVKSFLREALSAAGLTNVWYLVLFGPDASFPHGTTQIRTLTKDQMILIDTGGALYGYQSDISRTFTISGVKSLNQKQLDVWKLVQQAQLAALNVIKPGVAAYVVEAAARDVIVNGGYGPDYTFFTHRLGHGIGIQGHEEPYLVRNNTMILEEGMTFSVEPGIYIPDEMGVRIEDIVVVTANGVQVFGSLPDSVEVPFPK